MFLKYILTFKKQIRTSFCKYDALRTCVSPRYRSNAWSRSRKCSTRGGRGAGSANCTGQHHTLRSAACWRGAGNSWNTRQTTYIYTKLLRYKRISRNPSEITKISVLHIDILLEATGEPMNIHTYVHTSQNHSPLLCYDVVG